MFKSLTKKDLSVIICYMNRFLIKIRYLILTLFVLTNALIVFESSLPGSISSQRSTFLTSIVSFIVNGITPDQQPEIIDVEGINVLDHQTNIIEEGERFEIPLGVTRRFTVQILPTDATNNQFIWHSSNPNHLRVTSGGYLEARALGQNITVTATSAADETIKRSFIVDVVPKSAPLDFEVEIAETTLKVGYSTKLQVLLDERARREYNPSLLEYRSSNESVASINQYGIINALAVGTTTISVSNHVETYEITVIENTQPVIKPTVINLSGPSTGYVYAYTPLTVTLDQAVTDQSVTFTSSNEAIATVDESGIVYGTKVSGEVTITVYANADFSVYAQHVMTMEDVLPSNMTLTSTTLEVNVSKKITVKAILSHNLAENIPITNTEVNFTSSDTHVAEVVSMNGSGIVLGLKRGRVTITAVSVSNPSVTASIEIQVIPLEVINESNIRDFGAYLRKAVGHFLLFFVNGLLGALTFLLFIKKDPLITLLFSLIPGVFFASLSEFIQIFVEGRGATFFDVLIDSAGYLFAVAIVYIMIIIDKYRRNKKAIG